MENRIKAEFIIEGFPFSPNEITKEVGINPSEIWKKGDITPILKKEIKHNSWSIFSEIDPRNENIEIHINNILDRLRPNKEKFIPICSKFSSELSLSIKVYGENEPNLNFGENILNELSHYKTNLDIDIYNYFNNVNIDNKKFVDKTIKDIFKKIENFCFAWEHRQEWDNNHYKKVSKDLLIDIYIKSFDLPSRDTRQHIWVYDNLQKSYSESNVKDFVKNFELDENLTRIIKKLLKEQEKEILENQLELYYKTFDYVTSNTLYDSPIGTWRLYEASIWKALFMVWFHQFFEKTIQLFEKEDIK